MRAPLFALATWEKERETTGSALKSKFCVCFFLLANGWKNVTEGRANEAARATCALGLTGASTIEFDHGRRLLLVRHVVHNMLTQMVAPCRRNTEAQTGA